MPVGGDVTQFSIGLMAVLGRAIRSGRLPLWNDLWGYGFPGVGESQMGVFYPPHLLLYGLLPTEVAYATSLVLHTIWAGLGGWWAARWFGISPAGSTLAGSAWSASGFFVIHLPHQWGYTTGSWMPWAWGLAWLVVAGRGTRRTPFLLAAVLTLQVLPGHFQLAFITQVGVALLGLWSLAERAAGRPSPLRGVAEAAAATAAVLPLAAMQLWPTLRLARLATSRRDLEYLSGFAATPLHLVSYVAPALFRGSPLWRPLAWDPFHTSPEEHLAYVGLVPLFLALLTIRHEFRRDPATRALTALAAVTLVLSLGPYVPGFASWSRLPGFSYFRAPARWSLATALALGLLAGKGFDAWRTWPRPGRSLARFVLLAALGPMVAVAAVELALMSTERPGWPAVARGLDAALRTLPWSRDSDFRDLAALAAIARRRQDDLRVESALARQGRFESSRVFARRGRRSIAESWPRRPGSSWSCSGSRLHEPPPVFRDGTGRADGRRPLAPGTSSRVRPGPDPIPRGAEPGAGPAARRSARDSSRGRLAQPADGRRRGADLGLPDARPARAGVTDKPGPRAARGRLPARGFRGRRRRAPGDGDGSPRARPVRTAPHQGRTSGRAVLAGVGPTRGGSRSGPGWLAPWEGLGRPARAQILDVHRMASPGRAGQSLARPLDLGPRDDDPGVQVG